MEKDADYVLNYYEFTSRLSHFNETVVPKYASGDEGKMGKR